MAGPLLNKAERDYFVRKAGGAAVGKPLNQIKREYFISFTGAAVPQISLDELEYRWQLKVLANAGVTEPDMDSIADLWIAMVASIGKTPSKYLNDNMLKFYLNAP